MRPIVIDNLLKEDQPQSQVSVVINGQKLEGWQIAKPCNYDKNYMSLKERLAGAWKVFWCKAIPVQFFVDLTEEQKVDFVKTKING